MDSINREQEGNHHENLQGSNAIEKMRDLAKKASVCFLCTRIRTGEAFSTRPMASIDVDESGIFWFLSADDTDKNFHIQEDPYIQLLFQGSSYSDFMTLYGKATISRDQEKINELWSPMVKNWFTEGKEDPRITVIRFQPDQGYYWDTKHGQAVAFAKQIVGAVTGKTMDDSIEGKLKL
jgi:general stress protein 26